MLHTDGGGREELADSCNLSYSFHCEQPPSKPNESYIRSSKAEKGRNIFSVDIISSAASSDEAMGN